MKLSNKNLEEFLDENIINENNSSKNKKDKKLKNKLKEILKNESMSDNSETEPNIEISIIKTKDTKTLKISIEAFNDGEIINFDIEIDKKTFFELVDEMK